MRATFTPAAIRDLRQIRDYLMRENPAAAAAFADALSALTERLTAFPDSGRRTSRGITRFTALTAFPYQVFYRRLGGDEIRVLRVRHARRRPIAP
jgi:plasmid stabilization system protein ParE